MPLRVLPSTPDSIYIGKYKKYNWFYIFFGMPDMKTLDNGDKMFRNRHALRGGLNTIRIYRNQIVKRITSRYLDVAKEFEINKMHPCDLVRGLLNIHDTI